MNNRETWLWPSDSQIQRMRNSPPREVCEHGSQKVKCAHCDNIALEAEIASLRAQVDGWRPIETAPMDGTWILIWPNDHVRPTVGCWFVAWNRWVLSGWEQTPEIADAHWQPLPPPPKAAPSDQENGK